MDNIKTKDIGGIMKTTGLTYLEAVKALDEGKCEGIKSRGGVRYCKNPTGIVSWSGDDFHGIRLTTKEFLDEWSLTGVKQKISGTITWGRKDGLVYPIRFVTDDSNLTLQEFDDKPPMKVTLEWSE